MDQLQFLGSVWPATGHYCILTWFTPPGSDKRLPVQKVFDSQVDALAYANKQAKSTDVFYAMFSLRQPEIWDANKTNPKTGEKGAWAKRTHENMLATRCFFLDIDVGAADEKYSSIQEAVAAVKEFVEQTGLPYPALVSSGYGLHVYWPLTEDFAASRWAITAANLKQLVDCHGLRVDHSRTEDMSSVLRVPGTVNWKDRQNPQQVQILCTGPVNSPADFAQLVSDALVRAGGQIQAPKKPAAQLSNPFDISNTDNPGYTGPIPELVDLGSACAQFRYLASTRGDVPEPAWYNGILNLALYTTHNGRSGREVAHDLSKGSKNYSQSETDERLDRLESTVRFPARCATIEKHSPKPELCKGCPFHNDDSISSPIVATNRSAKAKPPKVIQLLDEQQVSTDIPDPPAPFLRLKSGGVAATVKLGEDEETTEVIYPYDIYPVKRLVNPIDGTEQHLWRVVLPREANKEFLLDADALYDQRKFVLSIANSGVYPHRSQLSRLQEYMTAYINELQRLVDADVQSNHLGWTKDFDAFILPDKIISRDGKVRSSSLSRGATVASSYVGAKGTLEKQVELMRFYENPRYVASQFMVGASLMAPMFHVTGHHGVIVNASGSSGASKSTTLYTAASLWGHPKQYPINGTNTGATIKARNERVSVLANLPICVDEITYMTPRDAADLAMGITQPGHRLRLSRTGVEQVTSDAIKSTIMLTTANSSLHGLLSMDNTAGTAGSMRVIEIPFENQHVHTKSQADDFLLALYENYGWIGQVVLRYCLANYDQVTRRILDKGKELDRLLNAEPSERFQTAGAAVSIVGLEIAAELGLLDYDPAFVTTWWVERQMPLMRGVIMDEYSDSLSIVVDYLEKSNGNIIITADQDQSFGMANMSSVLQEPRGQMVAHYNTTTGVMYVLKSAFKQHCTQIGASSVKIVDDLFTPHPHESLEPGQSSRIIIDKRVRRTLGSGTLYGKGQTWCFAINMRHPLVAGKPYVKLVSSAANDAEATG